MISTALAVAVVAISAASSAAQQSSSDSVSTGNYWGRFALGAAISLAAHESAHLLTSLALGFHPSVGLDNGRPTIFSGIDSRQYPHQQFLFSAAGLTTQTLIDELILDIPHHRGGAVERGILACGIGTTLFYITLGRNGAVSDVAFMSRTSSLSKTQVSLIFGGLAAIHTIRIARDSSYSHFFVGPARNGVVVGWRK
ncbi:MAG TPA: hypothetical protein VFK26_07275 [Gemmatimonadaceae bacterium]|jgi:hypothetical protein|nr:hypothetical protein [Gemmatimonadaceae bacterium]